jgi:hypothetical protein
MGKVTITINTDNAAFEENYNAELGWIVKELGEKIRRHSDVRGLKLKDSNGNTVGKVEVQ